ncbi:MAG: lipopolysaccharide biosynthesis protein RfbH, partial [Cellulosilyticaceae bacterium]
NIIKHPCFDDMRASGTGYRQIGDLKQTDFAMNNVFWVGVYPGMTKEMLDYMVQSIRGAVESSIVRKGE